MSTETVKVAQRTKDRKHLAFSEEEESKWNGPFSFIQAADTQIGMYDAYIRKVDEADVTWTYEIERMKTAILAANRMRPRPRFFSLFVEISLTLFQGRCTGRPRKRIGMKSSRH